MTISSDTGQVILIFIVLALGSMALSNTKEPVKPVYEDHYDQRQFDNNGCSWVLIFLIICICGMGYGLYWFFNAIGK